MKKTFVLSHPKIKLERLVDSYKFEAKKYIKRERNKQLPEGADFWDFDCRFGQTEEVAEDIRLSAINKCIDQIVSDKHESFYLEILAKPGFKNIDFGDDE